MKQYLDLCQRIINEGEWIENKRTGKRCLTVINADLEYDVEHNQFPLITTRKSYWKAAIAEMLGYLRGYSNAAEFRAIGCKTWDANANDNQDWLNNPYRKGEDDMGRVYGVQGRSWKKPDGSFLDQLKKIVNNLSKGIDDRGEILTFYNPGEFDMGCLRPCMHTHTFSILGDKLYLTSYQRSCDVPLGLNFNQVQVFFLLKLVAQICGLQPGKAYHKIVNAHIYEDQLELMRDVQLKREPFASPSLHINPDVKTLEDVETWVTLEDFSVEGYQCHEPIAYPFFCLSEPLFLYGGKQMDLADIKPLYIVWSDEHYLQGRPIIDEQHRGVLATINSLNFFLQQGYELNSLMPTIKILVNYLGFHHKTEAGILVATEYPDMLDYDDHTQQTMITLKRVMHQSIDLNDHQLIMKFLREWWLNHLDHHQLFNPYLTRWDGGYCRVS